MVNSVEIAVDMLAGALIGGSVSPAGHLGFGKLRLDKGIPGKEVIEPVLEVGKAERQGGHQEGLEQSPQGAPGSASSISTRRFRSRPSRWALSAIGRVSP